MLTFFAASLILTVGTSLLMARGVRKKKVNWPHVYELEHEIWPEIQHDRNHYFNERTDCRKCFNDIRRFEHKATPFKKADEKIPFNAPASVITNLHDYVRPEPPKYIPVRTSNEPLVATYSANAPLVQTMAFENLRVRHLGEVPSLRILLMDHTPRVGDCFWVESEREYFICRPHEGWNKI